jgi:hypothetical protein
MAASIVYNNGSDARLGSIADLSIEDWHFTIRNELDLVFFVTKYAWPPTITISMLFGAESPSMATSPPRPGQAVTMDLADFPQRCLTGADVEKYAALGVDRIKVWLDFPDADAVEPMLDHLAKVALG